MTEPDDAQDASDAPAFAVIGYDNLKAVAIVRDQERIGEVYRRVFGSTEGRAVLLDLMDNARVMSPRRPDMSALERAHWDGRADFMIEIFNLAGVDTYERGAVQQVAVTLNEHMERAHDGRNSGDSARNNGSPGSGEPGDGLHDGANEF